MTIDRHKMGGAHETYLAAVLGGRKTPASGSKFNNPMDGRNDRHLQAFAYAWDGKSTLGQSVSVTRKMWAKAEDQAGNERPMVAIRFYDDERLTTFTDLVVIGIDDFIEMQESAQHYEDLCQ